MNRYKGPSQAELPTQQELILSHELSKFFRCTPQEWERVVGPMFKLFKSQTNRLLQDEREKNKTQAESEAEKEIMESKRILFMYDLLTEED